MATRIIVKNLPDQITKEKLMKYFSDKGVITDIQLKFTKDGKFRKFAFIGYQKPEMAEAAIQALDNTFINTSKIQVETCAELGGANKPRAWSKYAPENRKRLNENLNEENKKEEKVRKLDKQKIKDPKVLELLKSHKDDKLFTEFMEVNVPHLPLDLNMDAESPDVGTVKKEEANDDDKEEMDQKSILANKDISDSEYIKLKTGVKLNLKDEMPLKPLNKKKLKFPNIYTIKLSGLPFKVKKSQIKEFLKPLKPFTIRRARRIRGVAYCGFKMHKEMKVASLKNRSFFNGRRIFVTAVKQKNLLVDSETEKKWKNESERMKNLETVAESGRIFVRNLSYTVTEQDLRERFEKYGPVTELILPIDSSIRKIKGFAIVTFLIPEHACQAFNELDGTIFQGRMFHLLPALSKKDEEGETEGNSFTKKKTEREKAKSTSSVNWNTFFVGENALAGAIAATYNTSKENVLSDKQNGAAVRLALGETELVNKMKRFLEENDVCLEAFENLSVCPRSKTVILVKNIPFGTKAEEIREKFAKFGLLKRVVLPPTGVAALVEFIEPFEAKVAFRRLSYSKFKHLPLYLEWAPEAVFNKSNGKKDTAVKTERTVQPARLPDKVGAEPEPAKDVKESIPVEGTTIFVKNLNFSTTNETLKKHFLSCGTVVSATVALKKNPNEPGKKLSMGYGFVEFLNKQSVDKALKTLQFSTLDNHKIELKRSNRTLAPSVMIGRKTSKNAEKPSSKIIVKNVPFQATQKEIADLFKVFGEIKAVRLPKKMIGTGSHRGFCFIEYNTVEDAKRAFTALSLSTYLYGRRLVLEWAAADDDVTALREKTAQRFNGGDARFSEKKKNITIEEEEE